MGAIMNSFVNYMFKRIAGDASHMEVQTTVQLLLLGELAKHAVLEGIKGVSMYTNSK
uniref:Histone H2B n=1 Tax=Salvator merianae TaxID=96440 RepID=A0A8D0E7M6_SALMN